MSFPIQAGQAGMVRAVRGIISPTQPATGGYRSAIPMSSQTIPTSLAPFFQEYDLGRLHIELDASTIIERTLRYGTRAELRWLFSIYPR